jgi:CrcB protein
VGPRITSPQGARSGASIDRESPRMTNLLLAGLGGFVGAAGRYGLSGLTQRWAGSPPFPWGTLCVNLLGCLAIGALAGFAESRGPFSPEARVLLLAGLLGGFTTWSAFGFETLQLWRTGMPWLAGANVLAQVVGGLVAVGIGLLLGRAA